MTWVGSHFPEQWRPSPLGGSLDGLASLPCSLARSLISFLQRPCGEQAERSSPRGAFLLLEIVHIGGYLSLSVVAREMVPKDATCQTPQLVTMLTYLAWEGVRLLTADLEVER